MLIFVTKTGDIYEPIVDIKNGEITIPKYKAKDILTAQEEGREYLNTGAMLAYVSDELLDKLETNLETLLIHVNMAKGIVEGINPNAGKRSIEEFMTSNIATMQHAGESFMIKDPDGNLRLIDSAEAYARIKAYKDAEIEGDEEDIEDIEIEIESIFGDFSIEDL